MRKVAGSIERWDVFELSLKGPSEGNPFVDVMLEVEFRYQHRTVTVKGFYDGEGIYKIRFMPDVEGEWTYVIRSKSEQLDGEMERFTCIPASPENKGPVRIQDATTFVYEDGSPYTPIGTTCYVWAHQKEQIQKETLRTLKNSPFNKIRMCVFPKRYSFNENEPEYFPFQGNREKGFDLTRFNPAYFNHLEERILELQLLGIEADLILFHPYDKGHWGFDQMDPETDAFYLKYIIARLSAYRNVWWSLANEFDFMKAKTMNHWDQLFRIVVDNDPYHHLRSIHNGTRMYDYTQLTLYDHHKPWVTHVSLQHWDLAQMHHWIKLYNKPVIIDECGYEGNLPDRWGNLTPEDMVERFWAGFMRGGYVGHGETYLNPNDIIWWSKGGKLVGESLERITFLQNILEDIPAKAGLIEAFYDVPTIGIKGEYYLQYFGTHRPAYRKISLPEDGNFNIDIIDTWNMTISNLEGSYSGITRIDLPGKPYTAIRVQQAI